jgi:hypothetical protein
MKELNTEVVIHADVAIVWDILINVDQYWEWNPFITNAFGKIRKGEQLDIQISPRGGKQMQLNPIVTKADYLHALRWKGHLRIPGIFDGEHILELHVRGKETCVFRQRGKFSGLLVPFIWNKVEPQIREGFNLMNQKLKKRAEAIAIKNRAENVTRFFSNGVSLVS